MQLLHNLGDIHGPIYTRVQINVKLHMEQQKVVREVNTKITILKINRDSQLKLE